MQSARRHLLAAHMTVALHILFMALCPLTVYCPLAHMDMVSSLLLRLQALLMCPGATSLAAEMEALKEVHGALTASGRPHAVIFATQRVRPRAPLLLRSPRGYFICSLLPMGTTLTEELLQAHCRVNVARRH